MMPYDADAKNAPQNALSAGQPVGDERQDAATYKGVAEFLQYLAQPEIAAEWHQKTGYLPITTAAYEMTKQQGFYDKNPGPMWPPARC
ncbi:glycerol-3-phosphate transporter periplasmic binding protein [Serratia fonticola]|uniref:Glycerol-3-phosphate transporter periplasmic binding protein n=1 Tax=Serratia fonticola TaxID=47917 RepID=A0A4V6KM66_SERFO|nr:glycerol-3-phosphate transporter periplasmic binding protein [Serratia fonticola]